MPLYAAEIIEHHEVAKDYLELRFVWKGRKPVPGQFFTIRVDKSPVPLLRRPFGFSAYTDCDSHVQAQAQAAGTATASTIYWRRGPATRLMAGRKPGETIEILGPLGTPFPEPDADSQPILVAGGVGVGPILFLADELAARSRPATLIIGARSSEGLPRRTPAQGTELFYTTDDGSFGERGTSIDLLARLISERARAGARVELYLCGPEPMLEAGFRVAREHGVTAWVAMEQTMGCAVGACMGCAIPLLPDSHDPPQAHPTSASGDAKRYARVCTEGPVFDAATVDWEALRE